MSLSQISFAVPTSQYEALRQRAGVLNIKPSEYAKRLYDAAYYVRCMAEKGEPAADQALDRQVRQVFMLADCEPEYIAQAIGMPVALAQKILDGWRQAAGELGDAPHRITGSATATPTTTENGVTSPGEQRAPISKTPRSDHEPGSGQHVGCTDGEQRNAARVSGADRRGKGADEGAKGQRTGNARAHRRGRPVQGAVDRQNEDRGSRHVGGEARHEITPTDGGAVAAVTGKAQLAGADSAEPSPSVPPPAHSESRDPRSAKAWPADTIERASALWADGKTAVEIAAAIGKKRGAVEMFASKNRDIFPKRKRV